MDYIDLMRQKENMCMSAIMKARMERQSNYGQHSKKECVYLQQAADIRAEMAQMSTGAEKQHQLDMKRELDISIHTIAMELNPELFTKPASEPASAGTEKAKKTDNTNASKQKPGSIKGNEVSQETVDQWFAQETSHGFESVVGMDETVKQLRDCVEDTKHTGLRKYLKMSNTHGFLLFGPPGCGKTFIATAFAHELRQKDYKYMYLVGADILSKYVGEAETIVKRLFEEALKNAPVIVFIDEIDSLCKNRSIEGLPEYASSITTSFLNGFNQITDRAPSASDDTIIFVGATNYPNKVDDAMVDRVKLVRIPLPDEKARAAAFESKFAPFIQNEEGLTYEDMARMSPNYNYRDIGRLREIIFADCINNLAGYDDETAVQMMESGEFCLTREMFESAVKRYIASPKDNILREQEEWEERLKHKAED